MSAEATEIMPFSTKSHLDDGALSRLDFASIMAEMDSGEVASVDISALGNGFTVLDSKDKLIDVKFVIVDFKFNATPQGSFVTLFIVTEGNHKYIVNDGGTGIYKQMQGLLKKMDDAGIPYARVTVPKGLTKSEYTFKGADNVERPACTYYLSLSK